jgi:hypothetical protein
VGIHEPRHFLTSQESSNTMNKTKYRDLFEVRESEKPRYSLHRARIQEWFDCDTVPYVDGMDEAGQVMTFVQNRLIAEFPRETVPQQEWEFLVRNVHPVTICLTMREHLCSAIDEVSMIMGLSLSSSFTGHATPETYTAPVCVIETVTEEFRSVLGTSLRSRELSQDYYQNPTLSDLIDHAVTIARVEAICAAVAKLDGHTPDCNRDWLHLNVKARQEIGPPDPFGSKGRFRYDLMQALIWWSLPKQHLKHLNKSAEKVTESDLTQFFCLLGYLGRIPPISSSNSQKSDLSDCTDSGGDDRTVRRWLRKYMSSKWPAIRSELVSTIRRTGYLLK